MNHRIKKIQSMLDFHQLDAILVEDSTNVFYLSQFTGTSGSLLITKNHAYALVDFRYIEQASRQCKDYTVVLFDQSMKGFTEKINEIITNENIQHVGFDGDKTVFNRFEHFKEFINATLTAQDLSKIRAIKDQEEIRLLRQAIEVGDQVFLDVFPQIKAGMRELDVVDLLHQTLKQAGATDFSFDTIVASGHRTSMPHGVATNKIIESNDIVTIDWGVKNNRYCSDCTRTFFMSTPQQEELIKIYQLVLKANQAAIAAVKAGVSTRFIDSIARSIISEGGYGDAFNHGTGHGLGIDIHEYPRLNTYTEAILEPNMVITIEPGIYIEGLGGVRIEDVVLVTEDGCEVLTKLSKDLQYIAEGK